MPRKVNRRMINLMIQFCKRFVQRYIKWFNLTWGWYFIHPTRLEEWYKFLRKRYLGLDD